LNDPTGQDTKPAIFFIREIAKPSMMSTKFSKAGTRVQPMTVLPAPPPQPPPSRTATYTAIACALSLAGGEVMATEVVDLENLGAGGLRFDGIDVDDFSGSSGSVLN
jgi:hypothetical protein